MRAPTYRDISDSRFVALVATNTARLLYEDSKRRKRKSKTAVTLDDFPRTAEENQPPEIMTLLATQFQRTVRILIHSLAAPYLSERTTIARLELSQVTANLQTAEPTPIFCVRN